MGSERMRFPSRLFASAIVPWVLVVAAWGSPPLAASHRQSEQQLVARIQREKNPIKKAKAEIKLARLKLDEAIATYDKGDGPGCQRLLAAYLECVNTAWDLLKGTGRNAVKKPQGFRELDLALRGDHRLLDDFEHRIPYDDRVAVEKISHQADAIHTDVLAALFPPVTSVPPKPPQAEAFSQRSAPQWMAALAEVADPVAAAAVPSRDKSDYLTDDESDKLREEQDPGARILLYLQFAQERLDLFTNFRAAPADPTKYESGKYLDGLLDQYISIDDEMKSWIQDQYDRGGDMRKGLQALLDRGPHQLEQLRAIEQRPDQFAPEYKRSLGDAIQDLTDTIDGATQALASQEKKFGDLKREQKVQAQATKEQLKEAKKRNKEEKKLEKKERKKSSGDSDED